MDGDLMPLSIKIERGRALTPPVGLRLLDLMPAEHQIKQQDRSSTAAGPHRRIFISGLHETEQQPSSNRLTGPDRLNLMLCGINRPICPALRSSNVGASSRRTARYSIGPCTSTCPSLMRAR
jgi:hypothetical protein